MRSFGGHLRSFGGRLRWFRTVVGGRNPHTTLPPHSLALVRRSLALVRRSLALVRRSLALVRRSLALVRIRHRGGGSGGSPPVRPGGSKGGSPPFFLELIKLLSHQRKRPIISVQINNIPLIIAQSNPQFINNHRPEIRPLIG